MLSRTGRTRLACSLCMLTLLALFGPAASAYAQGRADAPSSRRHRNKKPRRPRASAPPPAAPTEPPGPAQPDWGDLEDESEPAAREPEPAPPPVEVRRPSPPPAEVRTPSPPPPSSSDDMVISDPELEGRPSGGARPQGSGDDMVISDPELEERGGTMADDRGWGGMMPEGRASHSTATPVVEAPDPLANTGLAHLELIGQQGVDLRHEGDLEDAYESRIRFDAEVDFRRSRKLRMSIGLRTDLLWALPARGDPALYQPPNPTSDPTTARHYTSLQQDRWELDILPLSAFIDTTLGDSFHVRIGEQPVSIRRMDFYSPIDILAAYDLRGQPKLDPTAGRLSQPAIRADWDLSSWATLQIEYVPWFMPNLQRPNRDRYVATVLGTRGADPTLTLQELVAPSNQTKLSESTLRFVGPAPDFSHPQVHTRLTMRGSSFEFGFSGGTALEKNPSVYLTPKAEAYARPKANAQAEEAASSAVLVAYQNAEPLAAVEYHRYVKFGVDGSFDLSPLQFGWELAYSPSRHLAAATKDGSHLPQPNVSRQIVDTDKGRGIESNVRDQSIRKGVPMLEAAFHVDWIKGETFAFAAEAFIWKVTKLPYDLTRDWWGFVPGKGIFAGGLIGMSYTPNPDTGRVRFDASLVSLVGPSWIVQPQVEFKLRDGFYVNFGAQIFEGPRPTPGGAQNINIGGLYSGYDQFLLGFRYLP